MISKNLNFLPLRVPLITALGHTSLTDADRYVAPPPLGNNLNPGSASQPYATIGKAAQEVLPGETVWIAPGTYQPSGPIQPPRSGTALAPITFRAQPGGDVIIDGQTTVPVSSTRKGLFYITNKSYIVVDGLRVINSGFSGIFAETSNHITIQNCSTFFTYASGIIAATNSTNIKVLNNTVQQACIMPSPTTGVNECITMASVNTFEVAYNTVFDRPVNTALGGEGIDAKNACVNGTIHHNVVHDLVGLGLYIDAFEKNLSNLQMYSNTVYNCASGIAVGSESGGTVSGVKVYNNLIRDCQPSVGIRLHGFLANGPLIDIEVYQNTVVRCGNSNGSAWENCGILVEADNPLNSNFVVRNNILSQNTRAIRTKGQSYLMLDRNLLDGALQGGVEGTNALKVSPQFMDAANNDFRLQSTSPAIDAALGSPLAPQDLDDNVRPLPGPGSSVALPDLGAFEWVAPQPTTTTLASSVNPSPVNGDITLTAYVTGSVTTGTVTFYDGAESLGVNTLDASGVTTLTTSSLSAGSHSITAVHTPDSGNIVGGTSPVLVQTVTPGPQAAWVKAYFTDGTGTGLPHQYTGSAGEGWLGGWTSVVGTASVQSGNPLSGNGNYLNATRSSGSAASSQAGVYRQWSNTVRPNNSFSRLTFDFRFESDATFNNAGDAYTIALSNVSGTLPASNSTIYLRCFGASPGNDFNGNPIRSREWCVFNGTTGFSDAYAVNRFIRTGLIAVPGTSYRFTLDIHAASGAGTTDGKTHGTYDVTITDGVTDYSVSGAGFRSNLYTSGNYITFATQQNLETDNLAFSVDTIKLAPQNTAPAIAAGSDQTITLPASATLTGTVADDGLPVPGALVSTWSKLSGPGSITFENPATPVTTASFSAAGTHVLRLTGNDGSLTTTDEVTVTVLRATTTTSLASSANPSTPGSSVTFTATVTGGNPGDIVNFLDGDSNIGSGTLNGSGIANLTTTALTNGSHSITAAYVETATHAASTSPVLTQQIMTLYQTWQTTNFTPAQLGNPALEATLWGNLADPDADGSANLLEYAFASDPNLNSSAVHPVPGIAPSGHLTLTFPRIADPSLHYEVHGSGNLTNWIPVWSSTGAQNIPGNVTVTDTLAPPQTTRFFKLHVSLP